MFINNKTKFKPLLSNKNVVYYKNKKDLISKIKYYSKNDSLRKKIAKSGYIKYHKFMSNVVIAKYIMTCLGLEKFEKPFWSN